MRVAKPVGACRRSVTVGERSRRDEGVDVDKGSDSSVSFEADRPGTARIITSPARAGLGHITGSGERPERRARSEPSDTGDLPATNCSTDDLVFGVEGLPLSERQLVRVEGIYEV